MLDRAAASTLISLLLFVALFVMHVVHVLNCSRAARLEPTFSRTVVQVPHAEPAPAIIFVSCPSSRVAEDADDDEDFEQKPLSAFR